MIILSGLQKNSKVGKMQSFPGNLHHQKHYKENEKKKTKPKTKSKTCISLNHHFV